MSIAKPLTGRILVYSVVGCSHCIEVKEQLNKLDLPYTDVCLDIFIEERALLYRRLKGVVTVPQVFFNEVHIGGATEFKTLLEDKIKFNKAIEILKSELPPLSAPTPPLRETPSSSDNSVCSLPLEPDEYSLIIKQLIKDGIIKDHKVGGVFGKTEKECFTGNDLVNWACQIKHMTLDSALTLGNNLIKRNLSRPLKRDSEESEFTASTMLYRLHRNAQHSVLNTADPDDLVTTGGYEHLASELKRAMMKIFSIYLSGDGKSLDYRKVGQSAEYKNYKKLAGSMQYVELPPSGQGGERDNCAAITAFFINVYNSLTIHAVLEMGPPTSLWQRWRFFNDAAYVIAGERYSLQDIENGVLRSNRRGVGQLFRPFSSGPKDRRYRLSSVDPRIHFALVCGAKGCPPISCYSSQHLDEELMQAAASFLSCSTALQIDLSNKSIKVSSIFKWYKVDFGESATDLLQFIHKHMNDGEKRNQLQILMDGGKYVVHYLPYDWSLNSNA